MNALSSSDERQSVIHLAQVPVEHFSFATHAGVGRRAENLCRRPPPPAQLQVRTQPGRSLCHPTGLMASQLCR